MSIVACRKKIYIGIWWRQLFRRSERSDCAALSFFVTIFFFLSSFYVLSSAADFFLLFFSHKVNLCVPFADQNHPLDILSSFFLFYYITVLLIHSIFYSISTHSFITEDAIGQRPLSLLRGHSLLSTHLLPSLLQSSHPPMIQEHKPIASLSRSSSSDQEGDLASLDPNPINSTATTTATRRHVAAIPKPNSPNPAPIPDAATQGDPVRTKTDKPRPTGSLVDLLVTNQSYWTLAVILFAALLVFIPQVCDRLFSRG